MKIIIFLFLLLSSTSILANLDIRLNKTEINLGEPFILEIGATNLLNQVSKGGITVSFSSNVEVMSKTSNSKIYPIGSSVKYNNSIHNMMIESWYNIWPLHTVKTMKLELYAQQAGWLEIYIRVAFLNKLGTITNIPNTNTYDQQNYSVLVKRVYVRDSSLVKRPVLEARTVESGQKSRISLEEKIGQMLIVGFRGLSVSNTSSIVRDIKRYNLGGIILFDYDMLSRSNGRNIKSVRQVKNLVNQLQIAAKTPLFIAIDQEGGKIQRLKKKHGFPSAKSAQYLGEKNNLNLTYRNATIIASNLKELGFNLNFAPVVDLNINSYNPVIGKLKRSFSANPITVTNHARNFIKAHNDNGIISVIKHFPGHGSSTADSHYGITDITNTWQKIELNPYINLINENIVDVIMTAHIFNKRLDPQFPATLSKIIINDWLRKGLKYDGIIISDDMQMGAIADLYNFETAVIKAIEAGVDIILLGNNLRYEKNIIARTVGIIKSSINVNRINESYRRIKRLKSKFLY